MSNDQQMTRLSLVEMQRIEELADLEISKLPTLDDTIGTSWRTQMLGAIASLGAVLTLGLTEAVRSFGAPVLALLFGLLEFTRVQAGSEALGIEAGKATLVAIGVVSANVILPIYVLRAHSKQAKLYITRQTARGMLSNMANRLFGKPIQLEVDTSHNSTLHFSATIITCTTVLLAVYDVLSPLLTELFGTKAILSVLPATTSATPPIILLIELLAGLGLSVGGVLALQSISHEIALRSLDFDTRTPVEIQAEAHAHRQAEIQAIREKSKHDFIVGKLADEARKKADKRGIVGSEPIVTTPYAKEYTNGNGHSKDFLAVETTTHSLQNGNLNGQS